MITQELINLNKLLSLILRHQPDKYDLKLDIEGWVNLDVLVNSIKISDSKYKELSKDTISKIVSNFDKKRFEIKNNHIRAIYGHSIGLKLNHSEIKPPEYLYHGTNSKSVELIKKSRFLNKMERDFVHLTENNEEAIRAALRKTTEPKILEINAFKAYSCGFKFYNRENVWLTHDIPIEFIKFL